MNGRTKWSLPTLIATALMLLVLALGLAEAGQGSPAAFAPGHRIACSASAVALCGTGADHGRIRQQARAIRQPQFSTLFQPGAFR